MSKRIAIFIMSILILFLVTQSVVAEEQIIYVNKEAPYSEGSIIARAIIDECTLPSRQIEYIQEATTKSGLFKVVVDDEAVKAGKGRILFIEIVDAISQGNAFLGHNKRVVIKGRLVENGTTLGSFTGLRHSMGGAFAGYKGSCTVLERCIERLADDLLTFLKKPMMNARIGE